MKITFIGGGAMAEAMLSAILGKGLSKPEDITVSDIKQERLNYLKQKYNAATTSDNGAAIKNSEVVILAVKPQNLSELMPELNEKLKPDQLVLSIIAGKKIALLISGLNHDCIVRAMPNTPAQIGMGMTVWMATPAVSEKQRRQASYILSALGKEIYVDSEQYIDMATAISGSGPAYFFLMIEALMEAAVDIGLPVNIAEELAVQTMLGSGHLLQKSGKSPAELRKMVTSPGGTTEQALLQFEKGGFIPLIKQAVRAAYKRAQELAK